MSRQICPKCNEKVITWAIIDEDVSLLTQDSDVFGAFKKDTLISSE